MLQIEVKITQKVKSMHMHIFIFSAALSFSPCNAQEMTHFSTPYGQNLGDSTTPLQVAARDSNGTRLVVNGRIIDTEPSQTSAQGFASQRQSSTAFASLSSGNTLQRSTLNAVSIGNSIEINGARNSVITINQVNNGTQVSNASSF